MSQEHYSKLKNMYLSANINNEFFETTQCEISDQQAEISIEISDKYFHALGAMHGAIYFKLLDDSAYFAANSVVKDVYVLTTSYTVHFVRPVTEGRIRAVGKLKFASKNLYIAESHLYNEKGKEVAFGTGHFAPSKNLLSEIESYKL